MYKSNIILLIFITSLILLITSSTYAFYEINAKDNSANGTAGCFEINYTSKIGKYNNINTILETSDNYLEPYENDTGYASVKVSKEQNCKIYDKINIKLHSNEETSLDLLKEGALKYRIVNSNNNSIVWTGEIKTTNNNSILDIPLAPNIKLTDIEETYKIYLWVDKNITETSNYNYDGLNFSGYIYADSIQSSTITK